MDLNKLIDFTGFTYNWDEIEKIPEFARLAECEQNPKWHGEGNALEHTKCVCREMSDIVKNNKHYSELSESEANIRVLMTAALFHDIGKGVTTEFKKGNWHAYNHEVEGEKITRRMLWDNGFLFRESVCNLVRYHMEPLKIFEGKDYLEKICALSKKTNLFRLVVLKTADLLGSKQDDVTQTRHDWIKLSEVERISKKMDCWQKPSTFPVNPSEFKWNQVHGVLGTGVFVLIGLPGAGKDTFIEKQLSSINDSEKPIPYLRLEKEDCVVVCRDDIRAELGYCKDGDKIVGTPEQEANVTDLFNKRMIEAAKEGKQIIINNLNLKKEYREAYHTILKDYTPYFKYIYVEASSLDKNVKRRKGQISEEAFQKMIEKFDFPTYDEYYEFFKVES